MTPSPKEKAEELIMKFKNSENEYGFTNVRDIFSAIDCALIAVDEILNISYFTHKPTEEDELYKNYFLQVKSEIEYYDRKTTRKS